MIGELFRLGEQKVRPGVYVRWFNDGALAKYSRAIGIAAAVIKSNWGPLEKAITIEDESDILDKIGSGYGAEVVKEIFQGGAYTVQVVRAGTGGALGEIVLKDEEGTDTLRLGTKYPTSRQFTVTIRAALDASEKEFIVFEGDRQIEKLTFKSGENEGNHLASLLNETSKYFDAVVLENGGSSIAAILNESVKGGEEPKVTAQDYVDAFGVIEKRFFDGITVDSEDPIIHASLQAFVNRKLREGARFTGVVGEKITVPFETRKNNARSFNDFAMIYVGNGFETKTGGVDGAKAAGHVLGKMVSASYKSSLTKKTVRGSVGVYGELSSSQYNEAAKNGMLVFSLNPDGLAQVDYGINTLVSVDSEEDDGWKKIRRVRTRFELIDRVAFTLSKAMGSGDGIDNSSDGRQYVITVANGIINDMIMDGGLESGELIVDEQNLPKGDAAWFKFRDLVDLDGIEKLYLAFGFQY